MKKRVYKAAIIITIVILSFWGLKIFLVWGWEKGRRDFLDEVSIEENKIIIFENKLDSAIYVYLDFKYTDRDSIDFYKKKIDTTFVLNELEPLYLQGSGSTNNLFYRTVPLLANDSTDFPKNFTIKIYSQNNRLLKVIDYKSFMKYAKPKFYTNEKNLLTALEWTLTIDNSLLDLNKTKTDSIR